MELNISLLALSLLAVDASQHRKKPSSHTTKPTRIDNMTNTANWTTIDKAAIDEVASWMQQTSPRTTIRVYARILGCSYHRALAQFQHSYSPLSLGDLTKLCEYFGQNPGLAWMKILDRASKDPDAPTSDVSWAQKMLVKSISPTENTVTADQQPALKIEGIPENSRFEDSRAHAV
ncbi:hypothetical protein [Bifidobacterium xylocopae]|uniref:hypothetical protein n=1 Tax=Bifidobacterium xylocopae TaxID=2493119 RepID=UPI000FDECE25|nr:hypothetical protein [Bifidobacterium xylocopae]